MKRINLIILFLALLLNSFAVTSCGWIDDDLSDCPQLLVMKFYRQTPCETQKYYPDDVKYLRVFMFDDNEVLEDVFTVDDMVLTEDYSLTVNYRKGGRYTFVTWAGEYNQDYTFSSFKKGETRLSEMSLNRDFQNAPTDRHLSVLYTGQSDEPIERDESDGNGTVIDTVWTNLKQITNRLHIQVHGLPVERDIDIRIYDSNDVYDFNGNIVPGRPEHCEDVPTIKHDKVRRLDTNVMKFKEVGDNTRLAIYDKVTNKEIFDVKLVDELLMYKDQFGNPPYDLECDHDFNIVIVMDKDIKYGTWMMVTATVNDWNVVDRKEILE